MSGIAVGLLLDTDVLVDSLRGARRLTVGDARMAYSLVTLCELFAGSGTDERVVRVLLSPFTPIGVDVEIAELAGRIRRATGIRTPDALIAGTALLYQLDLVTRNRRVFGRVDGLAVHDPDTLAR